MSRSSRWEDIINWFKKIVSREDRITLVDPSEAPLLHMGDSDPSNEITAGFLSVGDGDGNHSTTNILRNLFRTELSFQITMMHAVNTT